MQSDKREKEARRSGEKEYRLGEWKDTKMKGTEQQDKGRSERKKECERRVLMA